MTDRELHRIEQLTRGPILRTLRGSRARLNSVGWEDVNLLMRHFGCSIEEVDYRLWTGRRRKVRHAGTITEGERRDEA